MEVKEILRKALEKEEKLERELKNVLDKDVQVPGYGVLSVRNLINRVKDLKQELCNKELSKFSLPRLINIVTSLKTFLSVLDDVEKYLVKK